MILAGKVTLQEVEEWYSVDDVIRANDVLDWQVRAEKRERAKVPGATS